MLSSAAFVLTIASVYLLVLGTFGIVRPKRLTSFLAKFASTPRAHYLEIALRLLIGASLLIVEHLGPFSMVFKMAGWVLVGTSTTLLFVPWHQHRRFSQMASPLVAALAPLIGASSIAAAIVIGLKLNVVIETLLEPVSRMFLTGE